MVQLVMTYYVCHNCSEVHLHYTKPGISFWDGLVQRGLSWFKNEEKGEAAAVEFKTLFRILKKHLADGNDIPCFFRELMAMAGWKTPFVRIWANQLYAHRQRRRVQLLNKENS